ncbi:nicotinamide mononucleotide transporter [bacterium]|nr:nicotinamide mononucleotide transporter [bacterium]
MNYLKEKLSYLWHYFTCYEKWWFSIILGLAVLIAIKFPEHDVNGVNGKIIEALYLSNIFFNVLCELLIAKQSKWNFIVSLLVEATEIAIPLVLISRFATAAVTLFFWIPIDIISFINWHRHPDQVEESLTEVRKLSGWAEAATIVGIVVWTFAIGTWTSQLNITTDLFGGNKNVELWVHYLDACVSAVGIANGLFILFRYREQWLAWYLSATLETIINILSGQYILLVLKAGYFTNTTYGYIKWTKYIQEHQENQTAASAPTAAPTNAS